MARDRAYFKLAFTHHHAWTAVYDFHLPEGEAPPEDYQARATAIFDIVVREISLCLPSGKQSCAHDLARCWRVSTTTAC